LGTTSLSVGINLGSKMGGQLVVKWVKWEFSKIGTSGSISRGDHSSLPCKSHDTAIFLYVIGSFLGNSMICFEKSSFNSVFDPFSWVYGLVISLVYIWEYQINFHE
jgi:hypothetical protein